MPAVTQAVILAGGQATRMRPYTDDRPKAMVDVGGAPIIEHQIKWLASNGVTQIVISCGYKADVIKSYLGDGSHVGVQATYAVEDEPLGRGGGLKFASRLLAKPEGIWLAINGDVLARFSTDDLVAQHETLDVTATIALAQYRTTWGIAELDGDLIRGFTQSPSLPYWINAGIYCFDPSFAELLPEVGDHENSTFPELAAAGKLGAYRIDGYWRGIDTAKDIKEATQELENL